MRIIKPKIIFSNYDDVKNPTYGGGGAVAVHEVAKRLAKRFNVVVLTGTYAGATNEIRDSVYYKRIRTHYFGAKFGQLVYHFFLPFYAMFGKYDLWIESFTPPFSTSFLPLFTSRTVIGLVHMLSGEDMRRKYQIPFDWIEKIGLKNYGQFIALSEESKRKIKKINKTAIVEIIHNGINFPKIVKNVKNKKHILFIGRIEVDQKGLDLLLEAFRAGSERIKYDLAIAGDGCVREMEKLRNLIKKNRLTKRVKLLGRVKNKRKNKAFEEAAFVVVPSRFETFPLVALEAFSYSLPIVCFDIEGLNWVDDGCCVKAKTFDKKGLARAMASLSSNETARKKMGVASRRFARQFSWARKAKEYENFIVKIMESGHLSRFAFRKIS